MGHAFRFMATIFFKHKYLWDIFFLSISVPKTKLPNLG